MPCGPKNGGSLCACVCVYICSFTSQFKMAKCKRVARKVWQLCVYVCDLQRSFIHYSLPEKKRKFLHIKYTMRLSLFLFFFIEKTHFIVHTILKAHGKYFPNDIFTYTIHTYGEKELRRRKNPVEKKKIGVVFATGNK